MNKTYEQRFNDLVADIERTKDLAKREGDYSAAQELDDVLTRHVYTQPVSVPVHISQRSEPG